MLELIGIRAFKKKIRSNGKTESGSIAIYQPDCSFKDTNTHKQKPPLPDGSLGPCVFARTAFKNLMDSGFVFTEEQMNIFGTSVGSKSITHRNLPIFWLLKAGETHATLEKKIRQRYWKDEFVMGKYRFLMFSQWYDDAHKGGGATKKDFQMWYESL